MAEALARLRHLLREMPPADQIIGPTTERALIEQAEEVLRGLPEEYIAELPEDLQEKIRRRLRR